MTQEDTSLGERLAIVETEVGHIKNAVTDGDTTILEEVKRINGNVQDLAGWKTHHVESHRLEDAKEEGRREVWIGVGRSFRVTILLLGGAVAILEVLLNLDTILGLF